MVPVVGVEEDDGLATPFPGTTNKYIWEYHVDNNSKSQPVGTPYNENMNLITLLGIYSTSEPFLMTSIPGWTIRNITEVVDNSWNFTLSTSNINNEIIPGSSGLFRLVTYDVPGSEYTIGQIQAQGFLISAPTDPVQVVGPIAPLGEPLWNPADFNDDGVVDREDLLVFEEYFGMTEGAEQWQGDSNGDGKTDQLDYLCLKENLGLVQTLSSNLPEVDTFLYLSLLGLLLLRRPRNNRAYEQTKGGVLIPGTPYQIPVFTAAWIRSSR